MAQVATHSEIEIAMTKASNQAENDRNWTDFKANGRNNSLDNLHPHFHSEKRQTNVMLSSTGLMATLWGGGMLSLPFAFAKVGILGGLVIQSLSAMASAFSLYIMISSARRTGATTYAKLAAVVFGPIAENVVTVLTLILVVMVIIAYMILIRDIIASILNIFREYGMDELTRDSNMLLLVLVCIFSLPMALNRSLKGLTHVTPFSLLSMLVLAIAVVMRGSIRLLENWEQASREVRWWPTDISDVFSAVPVITLSYLCHFNALSMHAELVNPTRPRLKQVIFTAVGISTVVYIAFGITGYLWAGHNVSGDVLNDFSGTDPLISIGRLGLMGALSCNIPLMVLPCRDIMVTLIEVWSLHEICPSDLHRQWYKLHNSWGWNRVASSGEGSPITPPNGSRQLNDFGATLPASLDSQNNGEIIEDHADEQSPLWLHVLLTVLILVGSFSLAVACPGVEVIWGMCGSSVGICLAYVFPAAIYLKVRAHKPMWPRGWMTRLLFWTSLALAVGCTINTITTTK